MEAVLGVLRTVGTVTMTELMEATGLTRTTVITVCDELMDKGWAQEVDSPRGPATAQVGRPARHFRFHDRVGFVLGLDVGEVKTTAVVADLRGRVLGRCTRSFPDLDSSGRLDVIDAAVEDALQGAAVVPTAVLAAAVGVAAPVDRAGRISRAQHFWEAFDIGIEARLGERFGWPVTLANDANLAALAERWQGAASGVDDLAVMLAGERIGFGLVEAGRPLRGRHGGAGEIGRLELVRGVGGPEGIARLCRTWASEAVRDDAPATSIRELAREAGTVEAEMVFRAAADGDAVAAQILERVADRMARVIGLVGTLFDPELVVIAGAVAASASALLEDIERLLPRFTTTPPRVAVSPLGEAVVSIGAIRLALDHVEQHALDLDLATVTRQHPAGVS